MLTQISSCHFHFSKPEMGKLFSRRVALTIQELAEGQCVKFCDHLEFCHQVVYGLLSNFTPRKRSHATSWIKKRPSQSEIVNATTHISQFSLSNEKDVSIVLLTKRKNELEFLVKFSMLICAYKMEKKLLQEISFINTFSNLYFFTPMRIHFTVYLLFQQAWQSIFKV